MDIGSVEGLEDDAFINAVDKFRIEELAHGPKYLGLNGIVIFHVVAGSEAQRATLFEALGADVGSHDDDGVAEVDHVTPGVCKASVVENLQEQAEDVGVSLFDFVEEHDRIGFLPDFFSELATFFIADVSRRGTEQARDGVLFHVLAHVYADEGILVAEEELSEGLCQLCLADAGGTEEDERGRGTVGVFQARASAAYGPGDGGNCFALADNTLAQLGFHLKELLHFCFLKLGHGDTGPLADDVGDIFAGDGSVEGTFAFGFLPLGSHLFFIANQFVAFVLHLLAFFKFLLVSEGAKFFFVFLDFLFHIAQSLRFYVGLQASAGAGFVDNVDGFIGKEAFGDIAIAEVHGVFDGFIADEHAVVLFVARAQSTHDVQGLLAGGWVYHDGLKATFEGTIFLDVFAIFFEGSGTDTLDLAA